MAADSDFDQKISDRLYPGKVIRVEERQIHGDWHRWLCYLLRHRWKMYQIGVSERGYTLPVYECGRCSGMKWLEEGHDPRLPSPAIR